MPPPEISGLQLLFRSVPRAVGVTTLLMLLLVAPGTHALAEPQGQLTWAVHFSIAPAWFDPAEHTGGLTQLLTWYALHDALLKPMPGIPMAPSLAESWSVSRDGLTYEFVLRRNVRFHNGDVMTAEDVKFSFERYRGASATLLKEMVAAVDILDPYRVRFRLREPWPDFMTFFGTPATGTAWIVPKKYLERVGEEGFRKAPVGAGPYKFVSFTPGVELVMEAFDQYWRKPPSVKRLVIRVVPDDSVRLAVLKRGEVDIAYSLRGTLAEEVMRTQGLRLVSTRTPATYWVDFTSGQWSPTSPWHDHRVRLAAALAIDRKTISRVETLGFSRVTSSIIPSGFEFYWPAPPIPYDPARAKKLLVESGYPNGFDAGDYTCDASYASLGEAVVNYLRAIGIRATLRPLERAAWLSQWRGRKARNLLQAAAGGLGNAVTRIETSMTSRGMFAYGSYPEIDALFQRQAKELDRARREALLYQIQKLAYERMMFVPIWEVALLTGVGPRVEEAGLGLIEYQPFSAPYEDLRLKKR